MYKIIISELNSDPNKFHTNWSITAKCEANEEGADPNVFVFHAKPEGDTYSNVASLYDMNSLPVGAPTEIINDDGKTEYIPYYRLPEVTLDFCNTLDAERFVAIVKYDTRLLVKEYQAARKLTKTQEVII